MLNRIHPAFYRRLRESTELSQEQFASLIGVTRDTLRRYESGKNRPDLETERKLIAASRRSDLEIAELLCELMSQELGVRVAINDAAGGYRPGTALGRAEEARRRHGGELTAAELRALHNKIHTSQLTRLLCERQDADLDEYVTDCLAAVEGRRRAAAEPPHRGATAPVAERSSDGTGTVLHIAGTGRRTGHHQPKERD